MATTPNKPSTDVTHNEVQDAPAPAMADTSWFSASKPKSKDPEALPHPFRYSNVPPSKTETAANDYLKKKPHAQAQAWQEYHGKASDAAHEAGQMGLSAKHKALAEFHQANYEHLKPEECKHCGSDEHSTDEHKSCAKCGENTHSTEDHPCDYCGSSSHDTDDHKCENCGEQGHDTDNCEAEACEHCNSNGHSADDCPDNPDEDEDRVGWKGHDDRGDNKPIGPLGEHVFQQIMQHGSPVAYDEHDVPHSKDRAMDRAVTRKIDDGAVHTDDLYRSYKHTPHIAPSVLLKYIVHRVNHLQDYDDAGKAERLDKDFLALHQFGSAKEKNGQIKIGHLHHMLGGNPHLVDQLVAQRNAHQAAIKSGIGLNTRKINGEDYVALTRGLHSKTMSHEHALSSWADNHDIGFGSHKHHTWVPLKDVWYSYDLGSRYPKGSHGAEDEFLVSHNPRQNGHRYKATYKDVTKNSFKGDERHGPLGLNTKAGVPANGSHHWQDVTLGEGIDRQKHAPKLMSSTDADLAHHVEHHIDSPERLFRAFGSATGDILRHPNAGPETWAALMRQSFTHNNGGIPEQWLTSKAAPAEAALAQMAHRPDQIDTIIQNPNLSDEQVRHVLAAAPNPGIFAGLMRNASERPNLSPKLAHDLLTKLDAHAQAHDDYSEVDAAENVVDRLSPEDRTKMLDTIATRPIVVDGTVLADNRNYWNLKTARSLLRQADPTERAQFVKKMEQKIQDAPDMGSAASNTWRRIVESAPPSDSDVHAFAEHGTDNSVLVGRPFTSKQLVHVMKHGNVPAIQALITHLGGQHLQGRTHSTLPQTAQAALLERPDFAEMHASQFAEMPGITPESVNKFLEKLQSVPGKRRVELTKALARNEDLSELTIKQALPPSAKAQLPFVFEKGHGALTSTERKKVAEYKKANPDTQPLWNLLTTRLRQPPSPKGHIIKPLPAKERPLEGLTKATPGFKFPQLGIADDRRETPILESNRQVRLKDSQMAHAAIREHPEAAEQINWDRQVLGLRGLNGASQIIGPTTNSYAKANGIRGGTTGPQSDLATKLHEDFHNTFKRIQATHGTEGRQNLARNLMANLKLADPQAHDALTAFHAGMYGGAYAGHPLSQEEHLTTLLNYLNDPATRDKFHNYQFGSTSPNNREVLRFNQAMKRAYKHTLRTALTADSKWTLNPQDKSKADWNEAFPEGK